jgi:hypothetical protein
MTDPSVSVGSGPSDDAAARTEIGRQRRVINQIASMQATLRDWDRAFGTALVCVVLLTALIGVAFAFAGNDQTVSILGLQARRTTWLGWLAVFTFAVTLLELVFDPRDAGRRRAEAVQALSALKWEYRASVPIGQAEESLKRLSKHYEEVMESVPEIPDLLFNRLKAAHLRKNEISDILSHQPGLSFRKARRILRKRLKADQAGQPSPADHPGPG